MLDLINIIDKIAELGDHATVLIQKGSAGHRIRCSWWQAGDFRNSSMEIDLSKTSVKDAEDAILGTARSFYSQIKEAVSASITIKPPEPGNTVH